MHVRQQIRDLIKAAVDTNPGVTVETSRTYPVTESEFPKYLIYTTSEFINDAISTRSADGRELTVMVEALVLANDADLDDDLDEHAIYLEKQLNNSVLGGAVLKTILQRSEVTSSVEGDVAVGSLTLTFNVTYRSVRGDPETLAT